MTDLSSSLTDTARALETRKISPVEVVSRHIERAQAINHDLNCLISIVTEPALSAARQAEAEISKGSYRGILHGIPFTAKDIFATEGIRTTAGSAILKDWIPTENSGVIQQLLDAGAILIGKNNLSEFASGPTNFNEYFGPARNPWNRDKISGGSSGGSAVAVAAEVGYFSLGTDTGGSVRIPAALTGTVGLKPSFGMLSRHGVVPLSRSLDTIGIFALNTTDAAIILDALCHLPAQCRQESRASVGFAGRRVGLPKELLASNCDAEIRAAIGDALALIEGDGAKLEEISIPWSKHAATIVNLITWTECAAFHQRWFGSRAELYGRHMREQILIGSSIAASDYIQASEARRAVVRLSDDLFERVDVIALPSVAIPAPPIAASYDPETLVSLRQYTRFASCTGQPAISVPAGFTNEGMPIGLQLIGPRRGETQLLQAAARYEELRGRHLPRFAIRPQNEGINRDLNMATTMSHADDRF